MPPRTRQQFLEDSILAATAACAVGASNAAAGEEPVKSANALLSRRYRKPFVVPVETRTVGRKERTRPEEPP